MTMTEVLGIHHPIIQAPMAGVTTPGFVAASAEAGVLGSIGAGYISAEETRDFIRQVKERTDRPFAVNLFVPEAVEVEEARLQKAYETLQPIGEQLGMTSWDTPLSTSEFDAQIQVIIEEGVPICSFTFGLPDAASIQKLKEAGMLLIGTATTVEEAVLAERAGMDAVVAQGKEAGGHRGSFAGELQFIPLDELLPSIVEAIGIPVIAAGGIGNKGRMEWALQQGAQAVQIGTALLAAEESGAHSAYKEAILTAEEGSTVLTKAFSGKMARGIQNEFIRKMENAVIAPYPYQNDLTKTIRSEAAKQGKPEWMSCWAGEGVQMSTQGTVKEILQRFI
ncbi:nitronate monooxygenase [Sporosarcina sp. 179-K 3D1 HS]|uniref:NAD(P)H-dependent flavin oxidoreductase n=1 Tax=Sporosarcina sp. 179-K 3D1 HS TaxID=3232169 RepID=UPI0039A04976